MEVKLDQVAQWLLLARALMRPNELSKVAC